MSEPSNVPPRDVDDFIAWYHERLSKRTFLIIEFAWELIEAWNEVLCAPLVGEPMPAA